MPADYYNLTIAAWNAVCQVTTFFSDLFTSIFTAVGLYFLITKRKSITNFFRFLTNFSLQNTITELNQKLNNLNMYDADDRTGKREILCILHEIEGQIDGNRLLQNNFADEQEKMRHFILNPNELSEAMKRGMVWRLREKLKTLNLEIYNDLTRQEDGYNRAENESE